MERKQRSVPVNALSKCQFFQKRPLNIHWIRDQSFFSPILKIVDDGLDFSVVKGIVYKDNDAVRFTSSRGFVQDLDDLPYPILGTALYERVRGNGGVAVEDWEEPKNWSLIRHKLL
jgi:hypothetical protein